MHFLPQKRWVRKSHLEAPCKFVNILHSGPVVIFMTIFGLLSGEFEGHSFLSLVLEDKVRSKLHMLFPCDFCSLSLPVGTLCQNFLPSHQVFRSIWSLSTSSFISLPGKQHWASLNTSCLFCKIKILSWIKYKF